MATPTEVRKRLEQVSDRISGQVRTLALGVIAFMWALFVGESALAKGLASTFGWHILAIGASAVLALFCDFLQYGAGYLNALGLLQHMEREKLDIAEYDYSSVSYRVQNRSFQLKQVFVTLATIWLVVDVVRYAFSVRH